MVMKSLYLNIQQVYSCLSFYSLLSNRLRRVERNTYSLENTFFYVSFTLKFHTCSCPFTRLKVMCSSEFIHSFLRKKT